MSDPTPDHAARRAAVAADLAEAGLDWLLVTHAPNVCYLTGFTGSTAALLLGSDGQAHFATDGRYAVQAGDDVSALPITITRSDAWLDQTVAAGATGAAEGATPGLDGAVTEAGVARELEGRLVARGADGCAFPTIVAAGEHGARPHHQPTDRPLRHGDLVTVDGGARRQGYCADMTRLVAVGGLAAVDPRLAEAVGPLTAAQQAGVAAAGDGVAAREVDAACRSALAAAGLADAFTHGTGHGIGLEVHEAPRVAPSSTATLTEHTVCTVEPGVYLPGVGGARIEDVVAVTADGAERLTTTPRDVIVV